MPCDASMTAPTESASIAGVPSNRHVLKRSPGRPIALPIRRSTIRRCPLGRAERLESLCLLHGLRYVERVSSKVAVTPEQPAAASRFGMAAMDTWFGSARSLMVVTSSATHPWYLVIWLTGVDYFSTLGYQPGIALLAAGVISPIATAMLVAVTLVCALPIYSQVAARSYVGQGSIAMLENLLPGWWGRLLVLVLLGFAATDFVITMTLSAADAATHATENPYLHPFLHDARMTVTLVLLALLALVFLKGFKEAIQLATAVCIPYLLLNVIVLVRMLFVVISHPIAVPHWLDALRAQGSWTHVAIAALILFPRLALGLSGFETGVSVMPLIRGDERDRERDKPYGRIRNTRKLLVTAAVIMSVLLLISSFVTTLLIPPAAYREGGPANGRAIAYMAHQYLGNVFGSVYDMSTILILWFAGASAMAGLLHLVPRYLPRVGLAPHWVAYARPLVLVLFGFDVVITLIFRAERQCARWCIRNRSARFDVLSGHRFCCFALERTFLCLGPLLLGSGHRVRIHHDRQHRRAH